MNATAFLLFFSSVLFFSAHSEYSLQNVQQEAGKVGKNLFTNVTETSNFAGLKKAYEDNAKNFSLEEKDGSEIAKQMKKDLEQVLETKIHSVEMLYKKAEALRDNYTVQKDLTLDNTKFLETKFLDNSTGLTIDETFSKDIRINKNASVVHIPTDVYKGSLEILNTINWTEGLNDQFKRNVKHEPELLWQYIGTARGIYRVYPGFKWKNKNEKDLYDNRRRGWYIQGSSSSKDMVILLDLSGSMVGSNVAIVKLAAMSLLDTLQENDFVNVVVFHKDKDKGIDKATMLCENKKVIEKVGKSKIGNCTDSLLQATVKNKAYLKNLIPEVEPSGEAIVSQGFAKALAILKKAKDKGEASNCIQTINFFTDGVEKGEEEKTLKVLKEENKKGPNQVRVFTYMTGREKGSSESPLKKFACDNRGYFYKVETLSNVREKVLTYMNVVSRPLVLSDIHTESWTPIYLDTSGLGLMITVVAPVFNKQEKGSLLGVVGTDVALPQLENTVSGYDVGANGYGFATNNNGFIVFHPRLKTGVEPGELFLSQLEGKEAEKLTENMVNRETDQHTVKNKRVVTQLSGHVHRISEERNYTYYYTSISNTSFSSAVAIPEKGKYKVVIPEGEREGYEIEELESVKSNYGVDETMIAPWPYCDGIESDKKHSTPVYELSYPNASELISKNASVANCSEALLAHLLFDAKLSREVVKTWKLKDPIVSIFMGTSSGLTRALYAEGAFDKFDRDVLKEEFYQQAADSNDMEKVVYSAKVKPSDKPNGTALITASVPIVVTKGENQTVVAVAGVQLKWSAFSDACSSFQGKDCHLIDDDGYVVYSASEEEVGKFYGEIRGPIMRKLIARHMFIKITIEDPQGRCAAAGDEEGSSAMRLLSPLTSLLAYAHWWTQTVFWFLVQMSAFFSGPNQVMATDQTGTETRDCINEVYFYKLDHNTAFSENYACETDCDGCDDCKWNLAVAPVSKSNLLLVVNTRNSTCNDCLRNALPLEKEKTGLPPFTSMKDLYRRKPNMTCYKYNEDEHPKKKCGGGAAVSPSASLLLVLFFALSAFLVQC